MAETREETVVKEMVALDTNLPMVIMEMARERVIERVGGGELRCVGGRWHERTTQREMEEMDDVYLLVSTIVARFDTNEGYIHAPWLIQKKRDQE